MERPDRIVSSEALSAIEAPDAEIITLWTDPQQAAWRAYRVAFNANRANPNVPHAVELVEAWNRFAAVMGLAQHEIGRCA